jgi:prepilin-type N-terminal cleavage/methylation domain-containing protein
MRPRARRGFSLLELMIVVTCIVILVSAGGFTLLTITQAQRSRTQGDADSLYNALVGTRDFNGFFADVGYLPGITDAANSLVAVKPAAAPMQQMLRGNTVGWRGPYTGFDATALASDPWGTSWVMDATLATRGRVTSAGPDKLLGTYDDVNSPTLGSKTVLGSNGKGDIVIFVLDPVTNQYLDYSTATVRITDPLAPTANWPWVTVTDQPTSPNIAFKASNMVLGRHLITVDGSGTYLGAVGYGVAYVTGGTQSAVTVRIRYQ